MTHAEDIPLSHIKTTQSDGVFKVKSQDDFQRWYLVQFENEHQQPSCECQFWVRNHLPCKHFFAIFRHYPEWGWEKLPQHYTNSPMLTLDEAIVGKPAYSCTPTPSTQVVDDTLDSFVPSQNIQREPCSAPACSLSFAHLPQKKCSLKALGSICREILGEIRHLTFLMDNRDDLENLKAELQDIYLRFQKVTPSDGGLQVEGGEPQPKKRKLQKQECPRKKMQQIPKQQLRKKHKYSGRHGAKAQTMRKAFQVHVDVPTTNPHQQPFSKQPTHQQPAGKQPTHKQPADKQPSYQKPASKQTTHQQHENKQPTHQQPTHEEPVSKQPPHQQHPTNQPTNQQHTHQEPASNQPTCQQSASKHATQQQPACKQPTSQHPLAPKVTISDTKVNKQYEDDVIIVGFSSAATSKRKKRCLDDRELNIIKSNQWLTDMESTTARTCYTSNFHVMKDWKTPLLDSIFNFLFTEMTLFKCCMMVTTTGSAFQT